jgi:hypothetical protein
MEKQKVKRRRRDHKLANGIAVDKLVVAPPALFIMAQQIHRVEPDVLQ